MQPDDYIRFHLAHSRWALRSLIDAARRLTPAQLEQDLNIGPGGLRANIAHTVERMFFFADNFAGREYVERPDFARRTATLDALIRALEEAQRELSAALIATAKRAPDTVPWPNADAGSLQTPAAFAQVFDHAALHRTQCINTLKRLGVTPVPDLDPLTFASANLAPSREDVRPEPLECFEYDYGALPTVSLGDLPAPLAREVFTALLDIDADTSRRSAALAAFDVVHSGVPEPEAYRHELNAASFLDTPLPQIVIWVYPFELAVEILGGPEWARRAVNAYIALFDALRAIAPDAPLDYMAFGNPPAFEAALAVPPATPYSRK